MAVSCHRAGCCVRAWPCANDGAGEWVTYEGEIVLWTRLTVTPSGKGHGTMQVKAAAISAVGETTGDRYRLNANSSESYSFDGSDFSLWLRQSFRLIGQGPENNLVIRSTLRMMMTEDGLVVDEESHSVSCR